MTVPVGSELVVIVTPAALTVMARRFVTECNASSCSSKSWFVVPNVPLDGAPLISPMAESSVRPSGSGGVTNQVYGVAPPTPVSVVR